MPKKQTVFYHYTSIDALYSIVSSKTFWLANAKSSNDKTERSFKLKKFCKMLSDVKEKFDVPSVIKAIDIFLEKKELVPEFEKRKFYILSLTNQKDNLAHWERYASEKHGIALALNSKLFDMLDDKLPSLFRQDILSDFDLSYSYDKCVSLIIEHINKVLNDNNFLKKNILRMSLATVLSAYFTKFRHVSKILHFKTNMSAGLCWMPTKWKNGQIP